MGGGQSLTILLLSSLSWFNSSHMAFHAFQLILSQSLNTQLSVEAFILDIAFTHTYAHTAVSTWVATAT